MSVLGKIRAEGKNLFVTIDRYEYRRINGRWEMRGDNGNWFESEIPYYGVKLQIADFEYCLRGYSFNEGPAYPQQSKKGNVAKFFRELQARELDTCTKGIFKPVKLKYDAHAENMARHNREVATRLRISFSSHYLTA